MTHEMKLHAQPFEMIKRGEKTIELRLLDEKRQRIRVGDLLVFICSDDKAQTLTAEVVALHPFPSFEALYQELPLDKCGYRADELATASPADMDRYYSPEKQQRYGVVGIELKVLPFEAAEVQQNTVSAAGQVKQFVWHYPAKDPTLRMLFVGNSITMHEPKPEIGWPHRWGMAASCAENDYVHKTASMLGNVSVCVGQLADWEIHYDTGLPTLQQRLQSIKDFAADVVVVRMGENMPGHKLASVDPKPYIKELIAWLSEGARQVIVTDNFWRREQLDRLLKEICDEEGYTFCRISDLYDDKRTMALGLFEHEGVALHPSDYGMERIAQRIAEKVKQ